MPLQPFIGAHSPRILVVDDEPGSVYEPIEVGIVLLQGSPSGGHLRHAAPMECDRCG
mgnify:FL=1